jgi:hypothetical protein
MMHREPQGFDQFSNSFGSLAIFAAIRLASSRVSK